MNTQTQPQQTEPLLTVAQAVQVLRQRRPDMPELSLATLSQLGKDCTLCANVWRRPTGKVDVVGKNWPSEKSYTFDVIREAFARNPATKAYVPEVQS